MKRLFSIFVIVLLAAAGCFGQTKPAPEIDLYNERFSCYKEYGVNTSLVVTQSLYGKVRIITKGRADLQVCFVKWGQPHKLDVRVVNHTPDRFKGEWQFVTREREEDFTIRITDIFDADISVLVTEGYDPLTKKYVKKKK
jgi:hypothetical protein